MKIRITQINDTSSKLLQEDEYEVNSCKECPYIKKYEGKEMGGTIHTFKCGKGYFDYIYNKIKDTYLIDHIHKDCNLMNEGEDLGIGLELVDNINEYFNEYFDLQPTPTKEQLRDEIISELNELWVTIKWTYRDKSFILEDNRDIYAIISHMTYKSNNIKFDFRFPKSGISLPLSLASKIIKYFELEESE